MSVRQRKRTNCQACGTRCVATPLELMIRGGSGWRGYWKYTNKRLCPVCKAAQIDFWMSPESDQAAGNILQLDDHPL